MSWQCGGEAFPGFLSACLMYLHLPCWASCSSGLSELEQTFELGLDRPLGTERTERVKLFKVMATLAL